MSLRSLRKEVVTLYLVIALLFLITGMLDSYFNYNIVQRNGKLLTNYETINEAIVLYNQSNTSFRLYNRNRNVGFYNSYAQEYHQVIHLLESLSEEFMKSESTVLYYRIAMFMLDERNAMIEDYVTYQLREQTFSHDYEKIGLMGNYVSGFLNDLVSAYLDQINLMNSESLARSNRWQKANNFLKICFLLVLAIGLWPLLRKSKEKMQEISYTMHEIGKRNFKVEDIDLTLYDDINEIIITTNTMKTEIHKLIEQIETFSQQKIEHEQQKRLLAESRFRELQAQINPHFLFNTLSMIIRHIQNNQNETSIQLVKETSLLLRNSLKNNLMIPLDEELELLRSYVFIQQLLVGERIDIIIDSRRGYGSSVVYVPPLILQPIVENAIMHGLRNCRNHGLIEILIVEKEQWFEVSIADNGIGMDEEQIALAFHEQEGHLGLYNVCQRLRLLYQREDVLSIQSKNQRGTSILLKLYKDA